VSGGAEAAVHVTRRLAQNLPSNHVIVKLDFSNAFNCIRRDVVAAKMPQIYCLVHSAYSCEPILVYGERQLRSREGAQQEPLGPLEFCEAIHPLLTSLQSAVRIGFMDDITLAGDICTVEVDVDTVINLDADTGLKLNISKCEIIASILLKFVKVTKDEKTLLGAPVFKGSAQDAVITHKIDQLKRVLERLSFVHSHDALVLLKNSLSMTKLLYLLQTSYCSDNPLQATFDNILISDLSSILNVDLSDTQWLQASLPVRHGGLGIRSAQMLAPSTFLASSASMHDLQQSMLPQSVGSLDDESLPAVQTRWTLSNSQKPGAESAHIQRAWDKLVAERHEGVVWSHATTDIDRARLLTASSPLSRDWLAVTKRRIWGPTPYDCVRF